MGIFGYICTMTNLSRHIEVLLLNHNCVIIPHLGGFVAQMISSRYVQDEQIMLPVHRSVGFNPQLKMNDGLLVQSYMLAYDTEYQETVQIVEDAVENLKERLYKEGSYDFEGVGRLFLDVDGHYEFEPFLSGITTPSLYGLDAFSIKNMSEQQAQTQDTTGEGNEASPAMIKDDKHYTIRLKKEVVNYIAAAIVALVFYLAWALPGHENGLPQETHQAAVIQTEQPAQPQKKAAQPQAAKPQTPEVKKAETPTPAPEVQKGRFSIVMATSVPSSGAKRLVNELTKAGYADAQVITKGKVLQVVCGRYKTEAEARANLDTLRSVDYFKDSWVTQLPAD